MQKRIGQVSQAFENCRFEDALRQIEQIEKKTDSKKKGAKQLSESDLIAVNIMKIGCLAATGCVHDAHHLLNSKFPSCQMISRDYSFLFLQICEISMDQRSAKFTQQLGVKHAAQDVNVKRFEIVNRLFSKLGKQSLKKYKQTKKFEDAFANTYLQYLNALDSNKLISFARDPTFRQQKGVNLKLASMFFNRFLEELKKVEKADRKLLCSIGDLQMRMAILQGDSAKVKAIYLQKIKEGVVTQPFRYLRSIRQMSAGQDTNIEFYIRESLERFRINLDFSKHTPIYDYYNQFLEYVKSLAAKEQNKKIQQFTIQQFPQQLIDQQHFYTYQKTAIDQLINYYQSLHSEFLQLVQLEPKLGKQDYYKISIKGLLLQLIKLEHETVNKKKLKQFLEEYKKRYGKTITYPMELGALALIVDQYCPQNFKKAQDDLIWKINCKKIYNKSIPKNLQQLQEVWREYIDLYQKNKSQIELNRNLEQGQRYLSDDFIIILADIVKLFLQEHFKTVQEKQSVEIQKAIITVLEQASLNSCYNFQLKLRMMYFYDKLNYFDAVVRTYETLDIKSVQFQTMGFWILKPILQHNLFHSQDSTLIKMLRGYQENSRECAEVQLFLFQYALKALEGGSYSQVQQYLCYNNNNRRSYNRVLMLFALFLLHRRKDNSVFYLNKILDIYAYCQKEGKKLTLNADFKTIQNRYFPDIPFIDFYGVYNNPHILKQEITLRIYQKELQEKRQAIPNLDLNLKKWAVQDLYKFQQNFQIFQRKLIYKAQTLKATQKFYQLALDHYSLLILIRTSIIDLVNSIYKNKQAGEITFAEKYNECVSAINKARQVLNTKYSWRQQMKFITQTRIHFTDSVYLLKSAFEQLKKGKKPVKGYKKQCAQMCDKLYEQLIKAMIEIKLKQMDSAFIGKQWSISQKQQKCSERDQMLERVVQLNLKELKTIYYIV